MLKISTITETNYGISNKEKGIHSFTVTVSVISYSQFLSDSAILRLSLSILGELAIDFF